MEQALAAIHQADPHRLPFTLELSCQENTVTLGVRLPADLSAIATRQFAAHYPDCLMEPVLEKDADGPSGMPVWSLDLRLWPDVFPIRRYVQFEDALNRNSSDPLTGLFAALTPIGHGILQSRIEIIVRPAARRHIRRARKTVRRLVAPFFRPSHAGSFLCPCRYEPISFGKVLCGLARYLRKITRLCGP